MDDQDIRWMQRFDNYQNAFLELSSEIEEVTDREFSKLEKKGLIQSFEMVQELCWKLLKDYLKESGHTNIIGSKDAFRLSNETGLITKGDVLMKTIKARNNTAHSYDEETVNTIFFAIYEEYYDAFKEVFDVFKKLQKS